jgi:hypothetical protein
VPRRHTAERVAETLGARGCVAVAVAVAVAGAVAGQRVAVAGWQWDRWKEEVAAVRMVVV